VGEYTSGPVGYMFFGNDHDGGASNGESLFSNVRVFEDANPPIDFSATPIGSYGGQDGGGTASIEAGGARLHLTGNTWKQIAFSYNITADTFVEFDFASPNQAEVHAIGLDDDITYGPLATFQVHGTQNWRIQDFHDYGATSPNFKHYKIPVGQYMTGQVNHLVFINDHDVSGADGEGLFENVRMYDEAPPLEIVGAPQIETATAQRSRISEISLTFSNPLPALDPAAISLVHDGVGPVEVDVQDTGDGRTFSLGFSGGHVEHGSLSDGQYTLTVLGASVIDVHGQALSGSDPQFTFHRIFGDTDGDEDVDVEDETRFNAAYESAAGEANHDPYLDYDADGWIGVVDLIEFQARLGLNVDSVPAPTLTEPLIRVNDGERQRSMVQSITLSFARAVSIADPAAALRLLPDAAPSSPIPLLVSASADGRSHTLSFMGSGLDAAGSLQDGAYTLEVDLTLIAYVDDGTPVGGGLLSHRFHRLYGDVDGDADVDAVDMSFLRPAFGVTVGAATYLRALDHQDDDIIDVLDLLQLRSRFGLSVVL